VGLVAGAPKPPNPPGCAVAVSARQQPNAKEKNLFIFNYLWFLNYELCIV
jgi:hypothetical protein